MADQKDDPKIIETTSPWYRESQMGALSEEERALLIKQGKRLDFKKNEVIFQENEYVDELYYVDSGVIKCIVTSSEGDEKTVYYTDRFLALECFFHRQPTGYSAFAVCPTTIYQISRQVIERENILSDPGIRDLMFLALSNKCRILGWQVKNLSLAKPVAKICHLLCCYLYSTANSYKINLTHQELADLTGMHRVTVTKTINDIKKMGIIDKDKYGHIVVLNWDELKAIGFDSNLN